MEQSGHLGGSPPACPCTRVMEDLGDPSDHWVMFEFHIPWKSKAPAVASINEEFRTDDRR